MKMRVHANVLYIYTCVRVWHFYFPVNIFLQSILIYVSKMNMKKRCSPTAPLLPQTKSFDCNNYQRPKINTFSQCFKSFRKNVFHEITSPWVNGF